MEYFLNRTEAPVSNKYYLQWMNKVSQHQNSRIPGVLAIAAIYGQSASDGSALTGTSSCAARLGHDTKFLQMWCTWKSWAELSKGLLKGSRLG